MLVSQHAVLSTVAAVAAAPLVRHKANLGLFLAAAIGQDVDHYLWHAVKYCDPSLPHAYRFFRSQYGLPARHHELRGKRFLHGAIPLGAVSIAAVRERGLLPIALGMAFHGLLDAVNEYALMPLVYDRHRGRAVWRSDGKAKRGGEAGGSIPPPARSPVSARR
ncbi:MAG: hypothetical protein ACYC3S_05685 [Chloroflexota bacterium]